MLKINREVLDEALKVKKTTYGQMSFFLQKSKSYVSYQMNAHNCEFREEHIEIMCAILGITKDELLYKEPEVLALPEPEVEVIEPPTIGVNSLTQAISELGDRLVEAINEQTKIEQSIKESMFNINNMLVMLCKELGVKAEADAVKVVKKGDK